MMMAGEGLQPAPIQEQGRSHLCPSKHSPASPLLTGVRLLPLQADRRSAPAMTLAESTECACFLGRPGWRLIMCGYYTKKWINRENSGGDAKYDKAAKGTKVTPSKKEAAAMDDAAATAQGEDGSWHKVKEAGTK